MAKQKGMTDAAFKVVANNKRATFDYELLEKFEAGLVLKGTEIKSVRANQVSLQRSYVQPTNGELWLCEANIAQYVHGNRENHEPTRPRKLLLHRREIARIVTGLNEKGLTMIPVRLYLKNGRAKLEVALARGKKKFDKRAAIADRDSKRQIERTLKMKYT
ncbi:MAG: SsrA-binding protein SmpB [Chloroflexi bacterium]|nr:SsrA-binding protein SmpB [Chloroflexota bacterium]MBP8055003.1 SsrA-binding protein SmpB [Chloroflexota bacterium]